MYAYTEGIQRRHVQGATKLASCDFLLLIDQRFNPLWRIVTFIIAPYKCSYLLTYIKAQSK